MAEFYRRTGHPASACFYYELICRRYPGTLYAARATQGRKELETNQPDPGSATPARVGAILIEGNAKTPATTILEQVPLYPGQVVTAADRRKAQANLVRLGLFKTVTVLVLEADGQEPFRDILIQVNEN
jgi:hypothetical protein